jgi:hypothetical protein
MMTDSAQHLAEILENDREDEVESRKAKVEVVWKRLNTAAKQRFEDLHGRFAWK